MRRLVDKGTDVYVASPTFTDGDGDPTDADSTPTVTATALSGATLPDPAVSAVDGPGRYRALLLAASHTADLDRVTLAWSAEVGGLTRTATTTVDVVAGQLVDLVELRDEPGLSNTSTYPVALLAAVRDELDDLATTYCGRAFTPRYALDQLPGSGRGSVMLRWPDVRTVRSVTVDGTAVTLAEVSAHPTGRLDLEAGVWNMPTGDTRNVTVGYEHGLDAPPADLRREALRWCRSRLLERATGVTRATIAETVDGITQRFSTPDPGKGRPSGHPDLDAALNRHRNRPPAVGAPIGSSW